jgi:hypothetical protein
MWSMSYQRKADDTFSQNFFFMHHTPLQLWFTGTFHLKHKDTLIYGWNYVSTNISTGYSMAYWATLSLCMTSNKNQHPVSWKHAHEANCDCYKLHNFLIPSVIMLKLTFTSLLFLSIVV